MSDEGSRREKRSEITKPVRLSSPYLPELRDEHTRDISPNGMFLGSEAPLPETALVKVEIHVGAEESVTAIGRVVWIRSPEDARDDAPAGMGIKFVKMDSASRERLDRLIADGADAPSLYDRGLEELGDADPTHDDPEPVADIEGEVEGEVQGDGVAEGEVAPASPVEDPADDEAEATPGEAEDPAPTPALREAERGPLAASASPEPAEAGAASTEEREASTGEATSVPDARAAAPSSRTTLALLAAVVVLVVVLLLLPALLD
jgi:hypothetical protein